MPKTKKYLQNRKLAAYDVYIQDTSETSDYFQISNLPSVFTGGRNSFLVAGSQLLENQSQVLIEILDSKGNTIYQTPVASYKEGDSKLVSVEIYNDTPIGFATIIIMGKARITKNGLPIPEEWKNTYNVRWVKRILVDPNIKNHSPIRFLNPPQVSLEENRFYSVGSSTYDEFSAEFTASLTPIVFSSIQSGYAINAIAPTTFSADYYNGKITGSLEINGTTRTINLPLSNILNKTTAYANNTMIQSPVDSAGFIRKLSKLYSGSFTENIFGTTYGVTSSALLKYSVLNTPLTKVPVSYANLRVNNMKTVSGEIYKVRVYNRVATNLSNYKLVGDILVRTSDILTTASLRGNTPIGNLRETPSASANWYAGGLSKDNTSILYPIYRVSGSARYYNPQNTTNTFAITASNDVLMSSFHAHVPVTATSPLDLSSGYTSSIFDGTAGDTGYFVGTTQYYRMFPSTEYTLTMDAYYRRASGSHSLVGSGSKVDIYLVSSGSVTRIIDKNPLGQKIGELCKELCKDCTGNSDATWYQSKQFNFTPQLPRDADVGLRFVVSNGFWDFSNISIKPATDEQFAPDEVQILIPNTDFYNEYLEYKVEFFDINSNSANVVAISVPTFFTGSVTDLGTLP